MRLFFCGTKIEKDCVNLFLDEGFKILFEVVYNAIEKLPATSLNNFSQ